jgi:ferric-dicitrate binding protein FerR (iron transport regulator)
MKRVEKDNELITRFVFNHTSSEEDKEILEWLDEDKSRYIMLDRLLRSKSTPENAEESISVNSSLAYVTGKINRRRKAKLYIRVAAVFIGLIAIASGLLFVDNAREVEWKTVSSAKGELKNIVLADGTKVLLAPASKLTYQVSFTSDKREVKLEGEAYFEVKHDNDHQFIVHTTNADIEVLGTIFNVNAYSNSNSISTVLVNGKVKLEFLDSKRAKIGDCILFPSQKAIYNKKNGKYSVHKVDLKHELAWRDRRLSFKNDNFIEVMESLERFYNVDIIFESKRLPTKRFTGEFEHETITDFLETYKEWTKFQYKIKGDKIYIKTGPM